MNAATDRILGAATVIGAADDRVRIRRESGETWARMALGYPYRPVPGDLVLAIGEEEVFIIGVLAGQGATELNVPGDLVLRAGGKVDIRGEEGIHLSGKQIAIEADRIETLARSVFEKCVDCYRWVKGTLSTRADRTRTIVKGTSALQAGRIVRQAEEDVRIDGSRIHLG